MTPRWYRQRRDLSMAIVSGFLLAPIEAYPRHYVGTIPVLQNMPWFGQAQQARSSNKQAGRKRCMYHGARESSTTPTTAPIHPSVHDLAVHHDAVSRRACAATSLNHARARNTPYVKKSRLLLQRYLSIVSRMHARRFKGSVDYERPCRTTAATCGPDRRSSRLRSGSQSKGAPSHPWRTHGAADRTPACSAIHARTPDKQKKQNIRVNIISAIANSSERRGKAANRSLFQTKRKADTDQPPSPVCPAPRTRRNKHGYTRDRLAKNPTTCRL